MGLSEEIMALGPDAYYPLTSDLNDASGNGNHLTVHQAGTLEQGSYAPFGQPGTRGTAVYDTGVTLGGGDWTLHFLVERKDPVSGPSPYSVLADGTDEDDGAGAWASLGSMGFLKWTDAGTTYFGYEGDGTAYHFIAVNSGGSLTVYRSSSFNGGPGSGITSTTVLPGQTPSGSTLKLGNAGGAMYAQVAIFDGLALSEAQALAIFTGSPVGGGPEPTPGADVLDPYSVDGAITASVPIYGFNWNQSGGGGGSGTLTSGQYVTDEGGVVASLGLFDGVDAFPLPTFLSVDIDIPAGFDGLGTTAAVGWSMSSARVRGAWVKDGDLYVGFTEGASFSSALAVAVDVTAGTHTLSVLRAGGGDGTGGRLDAWWDGVWVSGTTVEPDAEWEYGLEFATTSIYPSFALYDNATNETFSFGPLSGFAGDGEVGGLESPDLDGGLVRMTGVDNNLYVGGLEAPELVGGVQAPINSDLLVDVHVGGLESVPLTGGLAFSYSPTTFPPNLPITTPGYQYGTPSAVIEVGGYDHRLSASFSAAMNSASSGNFDTLPPGPTEGDEITVTVGGRAVLTGYAETSDHEVAPGEESEQTVSVSLTDILEVDWTESIVWPDIAASEPIRLGRPPQSDRTWDWHSNAGMYDRLELVSSVGGDNAIYGTANENHPFPDNWPDPYSKWMWDRNPDQDNIPAGWVYFRVPFGLLFAKEVGIFLCAWDYATLSIDGQQFIEADQPGATFRHDLHLDWDYHLVTIAAYTAGGKAGVNCSIMPKEKHGFTPSVMNSRGGWEVLSYPEKPLRFTVGKVLERLVIEAQDRGAPAGNWELMFDKNQDSAGNPWPTDDSLITTSVGMTYWDVLNQLAEDRIDFRAAPSGRKLYAYVKGEPPRTVGSPWTAGATLSDRYEDRAVR